MLFLKNRNQSRRADRSRAYRKLLTGQRTNVLELPGAYLPSRRGLFQPSPPELLSKSAKVRASMSSRSEKVVILRQCRQTKTADPLGPSTVSRPLKGIASILLKVEVQLGTALQKFSPQARLRESVLRSGDRQCRLARWRAFGHEYADQYAGEVGEDSAV